MGASSAAACSKPNYSGSHELSWLAAVHRSRGGGGGVSARSNNWLRPLVPRLGPYMSRRLGPYMSRRQSRSLCSGVCLSSSNSSVAAAMSGRASSQPALQPPVCNPTPLACNFYASQAATLCVSGCNLMRLRLQPYVSQASSRRSTTQSGTRAGCASACCLGHSTLTGRPLHAQTLSCKPQQPPTWPPGVDSLG